MNLSVLVANSESVFTQAQRNYVSCPPGAQLIQERQHIMLFLQRIKKNKAIDGPGNPRQKHQTARAGGVKHSHRTKASPSFTLYFSKRALVVLKKNKKPDFMLPPVCNL